MRINENIVLVDGAEFDSNVYLINNEIMVDCGSGVFFEETLEQMEHYGLKLGKIKKVIFTHCHFDHVGAAPLWKKKIKVKFFIHENDREALEKGIVGAEFFGESFEGFKVDGVVKEGDVIKTGSYSFQVLHTPGHSPGSIVLWEPEKGILVSGDTLFTDGWGRSDLPGGSKEKLMESLRRIKNLGDIQILLPGHGVPASKHDIYARDAIKKILDRIE